MRVIEKSIQWLSKSFILMLMLLLVLLSCNRQGKEKKTLIDKKQFKEEFIKSNQKLVSHEAEDIKDFLIRYGWEMKETGNGLYYNIYSKGNGRKVISGDTVTLKYKLFFLTGDLIETSQEKGPIHFIAGKEKVISGLHDGVKLLHYGDKAKFIIPSHLAYGLIGEKGRIPPKTTLIYDVELIENNQ